MIEKDIPFQRDSMISQLCPKKPIDCKTISHYHRECEIKTEKGIQLAFNSYPWNN